MKRYGTIYKITNKETGMSYIGQTVSDVKTRFSAHKNDTRKNRYITSTIRKHGEENFIFEELLTCFNIESLNYFEDLFIKQFNTLAPLGYNLRPGGNQYGKMSEETKTKISKSKTGVANLLRRGQKVSDERRSRISKTLGGQIIVAVCEDTNRTTFYVSAHETTAYGFQPWNVISVCKNRRPRHKGHKFYYYNDYANQSGSHKLKSS